MALPLAKKLLQRNTHTVRTLRNYRKGLPKDVINAKLNKGEICRKQNEDGIIVTKWKDKGDMRILSTYHNLDIVNIGKKNRRNEEIKKPQCVVDYNAGKTGIDLSDQMSSYSSPVRKSLRWYHKVATELLMGTTVVNSLVLYKSIYSESKMSITQFCTELVNSPINIGSNSNSNEIYSQTKGTQS
ncbi:hypothetical protein NQ314_018276 [Rhamnusium bicolor]|uniref:PiggyBac transposable element-derived protein domain-containing protein n=1 Tax=Rhamnusium bicolor TaxID=1586634 RepID=A0AAV8WS53_9CUCU|nr:hypothetical protein NQ314_018276 [Rhamnusium bicolor]